MDFYRYSSSTIAAPRGSHLTCDGAHFSLGLWMRNNWGLWDDSQLDQYFSRMGVTEADDMSMIILKSFWRHLNAHPIGLQQQLRLYQDMAKKRTLVAN